MTFFLYHRYANQEPYSLAQSTPNCRLSHTQCFRKLTLDDYGCTYVWHLLSFIRACVRVCVPVSMRVGVLEQLVIEW